MLSRARRGMERPTAVCRDADGRNWPPRPVCAGLRDFSDLPSAEHVKIVSAMRHAAITQMTASAESVAAAADLLEDFAHARRAGATGGLIPRGPAAS